MKIKCCNKQGILLNTNNITSTNPVYLSNNQLSHMEKYWLNHAKILHDKHLELLTGLTCYTRINSGNTPSVSLALNCIAPLYIPFIVHVLDDAQANNIKQLFFLSRDGYILYKITSQLKKAYHNIELNYLNVSRKSVLMPYLIGSKPKELLALYPNNTIKEQNTDIILSKLSITKKDLNYCNITIPFKKIRTQEEEKELLKIVFSPPLYNIWQERHLSQKKDFLSYLNQKGILKMDSIAFVDVGWLGTTSIMLHSILKANNPNLKTNKTYFWGARKDVIKFQDNIIDVFTDFYDGGGRLYTFIEDYCSACPHPTTIGYKNGEPIFKEKELSEKYLSLVQDNTSVCENIARTISELNISPISLKKWTKLTYKALNEFLINIDYSPLENVPDFDEILVKKLTFNEIVSIMKRKRVTTMDIASLDYTIGHNTRRALFKIAGINLK